MTRERTCGTCRFYTVSMEHTGFCHYNAPIVHSVGASHQTVFPFVVETNFCGQWKHKGMDWPYNRGNYICGKCGRLGLYSPEANCCTRCDPSSPDYMLPEEVERRKTPKPKAEVPAPHHYL